MSHSVNLKNKVVSLDSLNYNNSLQVNNKSKPLIQVPYTSKSKKALNVHNKDMLSQNALDYARDRLQKLHALQMWQDNKSEKTPERSQ
jgi:hypothetical protein